MPWILLFGAIATEIVATVSLKASDGFSKVGPSVVVVIGYVASFALLAQALKTIEVGVAYAIWSAVGTAAVALLGIWLFGETASFMKAVWIAVIVAVPGAFPVWLAPVQVEVLPITDRQLEYAKQVEKKLADAGVRVHLDDRKEKVNLKIREAQLQKSA